MRQSSGMDSDRLDYWCIDQASLHDHQYDETSEKVQDLAIMDEKIIAFQFWKIGTV